MMISAIMLLLLLSAVFVVSLAVLYCIVRARNKRLLFDMARGTSSDALDCIGISVLGSDVYDPAQVENLLTVEYTRYQVVLVLDARRRASEFDALVTRYRMISVDYTPSGELPSEGVRGLYRSRKRSYRRLVLIDRAQQSAEQDFDVAAGVASYDYLLPVCNGQYLRAEAIERLVVEVGERPCGTLEQVRVCVGEPALLLSRESVVQAGGFVGNPDRGFFRRQVKWLWEPVFRTVLRPVKALRVMRVVLALLLAAGTIVAVWTANWQLLSVLLTVAFAWCCAEYAAQLLGNGENGPVRLFPCWRPVRYKKFS